MEPKTQTYITTLKLETRIKTDLGELLATGQITNALAVEKELGVASRAIPGYYAGNRKAETVMVMLNPGCDADKAIYDSTPKLALYRYLGIDAFYNNLINESNNAGYGLGTVLDYFDLKTAAFLSAWPDSGIQFPPGFADPSKPYDAVTDDKQLRIEANRNCLLQKLQLELVPYPSSGFTGIKKKDVRLLFPFVETLFDEIFSTKRKYVIFAGGVFATILSDAHYENVVKLAPKITCQNKLLKDDGNPMKKEVSCTPITINYNGEQHRAIIANSFPRQDMSRALGIMRQYGEFCCQNY